MTSGTGIEWIFLVVAGVLTLAVAAFFFIVLRRGDGPRGD